jgi:hypothetical protein
MGQTHRRTDASENRFSAVEPVCWLCHLPYGSSALCRSSLVPLPFGRGRLPRPVVHLASSLSPAEVLPRHNGHQTDSRLIAIGSCVHPPTTKLDSAQALRWKVNLCCAYNVASLWWKSTSWTREACICWVAAHRRGIACAFGQHLVKEPKKRTEKLGPSPQAAPPTGLVFSKVGYTWCGRRESNPHGVSPSGF